MKAIYFIIFLAFAFTACDPQEKYIEATGTLELQGITSYQYGTHVLVNTDQRYALRSEHVPLDSFVEMSVIIQGNKVEGYPLEGGPVLLEVVDIEKRE